MAKLNIKIGPDPRIDMMKFATMAKVREEAIQAAPAKEKSTVKAKTGTLSRTVSRLQQRLYWVRGSLISQSYTALNLLSRFSITS